MDCRGGSLFLQSLRLFIERNNGGRTLVIKQHRFMHWLCLLLLALPLVCVGRALAQQQGDEPLSEDDSVLAEQIPALKTPRATLRTFLRSMQEGEDSDAIECLDLSYLTSDAVSSSGPNIAHQVKTALDRLVGITRDSPDSVWNQIPDQPDFEEPFQLDGIPGARSEASRMVVARGEDGNWRFTADTCREVERYFAEVEQLPTLVDEQTEEENLKTAPFAIRLRQWFPRSLHGVHFLLPDYQWVCLLIVIFFGLVADVVTRNLMTWIVDHWFSSTDESETEPTGSTEKVWKPLGRLANASTWYFGTKLIGLPSVALNVLLVILKLFTIVAAAWTAFAVIDLAGKHWEAKAKKTATRFDDLLVPIVTKTLKLFVFCIAVLTGAQAFDLPILGLMGGLGLGGAALALASKDAVANFFGSITVLFDRPFEVGDWIITEGAEGSVEAVGFRSTRIRTFYNSLITLPNSLLTTSVVDNMGRRRYRRIKTVIGVQYDTTPEQLDAFCEGIRELIRRYPSTRKDFYHVYFNDFGPSSLNILLYCFVACPDWSSELRERHRLLADIIRLAKQLGVQFAFPTQTVHLFNEKADGATRQLSNPEEQGRQLAAELVGDGRGS